MAKCILHDQVQYTSSPPSSIILSSVGKSIIIKSGGGGRGGVQVGGDVVLFMVLNALHPLVELSSPSSITHP